MASSPWYETSFAIAIIGSIIAIVGQLGGTLIPIMWGPESVSDFAVYADDPAVTLLPNQNQLFTSIYVEDLHSFLRPYMHAIHLITVGQPESINIDFSKGDHLTGTNEVEMVISRKSNQTTPSGKYLVDIVGLGGDGKERNCSVLLYIPSVPLSETYNVTIASALKNDRGLNITIYNNGTTAMNLTDWKLATDNRNTIYIIPVFTLKSKASVTIHSQEGNDTVGNLYGSNFTLDGTHEVRLLDDDGSLAYDYILSATPMG